MSGDGERVQPQSVSPIEVCPVLGICPKNVHSSQAVTAICRSPDPEDLFSQRIDAQAGMSSSKVWRMCVQHVGALTLPQAKLGPGFGSRARRGCTST